MQICSVAKTVFLLIILASKVYRIHLNWLKSKNLNTDPLCSYNQHITTQHGLAPTCVADDCLAISAIAGRRHIRSARTGLLSIPRTTTTLGVRSFEVADPVIWNSLPATLRTTTLSPRRLLTIWRPTCLDDWQHVWGLLMMRSTNPLIIFII